MSRIIIPSLVVALLVPLTLLSSAMAQTAESVAVPLTSLDSSGVSGSALLTGTGSATNVELTLSGLKPGSTYSARLHAGSCDSPSASAAALPDLAAGADGTAAASGALLFQGQSDVDLDSVADGEHVIVISLETAVACGAIPPRSTLGGLISGSVPQSGGFGLFVFGGGTYDQLVSATGCPLSSARFWVTVNGQFVVLIPGAAAASVNAPFDAVFGGAIPPGTVMLGSCVVSATHGSLPNGTSFVFVRSVGEQAMVVDPALFLTGDDALAAAREDGVIDLDEDLPNDFYIRNSETAELTLPVAEGTSFTLIGFDASGGLQDANVSFPEFQMLLSGTADTSPYYSVIPGNLPMNVFVDDGVVVGGTQQYLP